MMRILLNLFKYIFNSSRYDTFLLGAGRITHHGVCLSSSSLSICEDSAIDAAKDAFNDRLGNGIIYMLLRVIRVE